MGTIDLERKGGDRRADINVEDICEEERSGIEERK
jgi:hypothetical protein